LVIGFFAQIFLTHFHYLPSFQVVLNQYPYQRDQFSFHYHGGKSAISELLPYLILFRFNFMELTFQEKNFSHNPNYSICQCHFFVLLFLSTSRNPANPSISRLYNQPHLVQMEKLIRSHRGPIWIYHWPHHPSSPILN
jgi:hypothetical protein